MMGIVHSFARVDRIQAADVDQDGVLESAEFNALSNRDKRRIRRDLGEEKWAAFVEARRHSYQEKVEGQQQATQSAASEEREHRNTITPNFEKATFQRTLERGTRGADVQALQQFLLNAGYNPNGVDGSFGGGTRRALMNYQRANDLPVSGKIAATATSSSKTLNHMLSSLRQPTRAEQRRADRETRRADRATRQTARQERRETTSSRQIVYPPQGVEATKALQVLIGTPDDGKFGPNSRKQLQRFLKSAGHYTGAIDGQIGRGSKAAIEAYNSGSPSARIESNDRPRNFLTALRDFFRNGRNRPNLEGIDEHINATDRDLHGLDARIGAATSSGNETQINEVYNEALRLLNGRISADLYATMQGARTKNQKNRVLDFISNALMGGTRTVEITQGQRSAREYAPNLTTLRDATANVLRNEGFSSSFITATLAQMEIARGQILQASSVTNGYSQSTAAFSVRSRGSNRHLQAFSRGSTESISIDGVRTWDVPENDQDIQSFIENMSSAQLEDIGRELGVRNLTKEELQEFVNEGKVLIDAKMILAHNCGNVGYELDFTNKIPRREREGGDGGNSDGTPGSTPGDTDGDPGDPSDGDPGDGDD